MTPSHVTRIVVVVVVSCLVTACENREASVRRVKEPMETVADDMDSLESAYREAKTRLATVRDSELRGELSTQLDADYQRQAARIQAAIARAQQEQREREARERAEAEQRLVRQAVADLETGMRGSAFNDGTQVLVLRNAQSFPVKVDLKCFTRDNTFSKTIFVTVPARGEAEVGFIQGWRDNFREGEHCEAYFAGELLWNRTVPAL
jgi:hypothetical protein